MVWVGLGCRLGYLWVYAFVSLFRRSVGLGLRLLVAQGDDNGHAVSGIGVYDMHCHLVILFYVYGLRYALQVLKREDALLLWGLPC